MMGGWFGMMIIPVILIGFLIFLSYNKGHNNAKDIDNSLNILKERFALGEINEEEYINRKNILLNNKK